MYITMHITAAVSVIIQDGREIQTFHILMWPSAPAVARRLPSGENTAQLWYASSLLKSVTTLSSNCTSNDTTFFAFLKSSAFVRPLLRFLNLPSVQKSAVGKTSKISAFSNDDSTLLIWDYDWRLKHSKWKRYYNRLQETDNEMSWLHMSDGLVVSIVCNILYWLVKKIAPLIVDDNCAKFETYLAITSHPIITSFFSSYCELSKTHTTVWLTIRKTSCWPDYIPFYLQSRQFPYKLQWLHQLHM